VACKKSLTSVTEILQGQILIPFTHASCLLPDDCAGRIARELWWMSQDFLLLTSSFHHGSPCSYITCRMNNRPDGGRRSETWSHPIDIIIITTTTTIIIINPVYIILIFT
jgi:hypothetical protein